MYLRMRNVKILMHIFHVFMHTCFKTLGQQEKAAYVV